MTRRNSSGLISQNGAKTEVNATFTQTSIGPNWSSACSAARSTASKSATSVGTASAAAAGLLHRLGRRLQAVEAARDQHDVRAAAPEELGRGPADAGARAGDHYCLGHVSALLLRLDDVFVAGDALRPGYVASLLPGMDRSKQGSSGRMRSGGRTGKGKTGTASTSGGRSGGKAQRAADDLPTPRVLREYALVADGERGAVIGPDGSIGVALRAALGQPGRLQRPARRPRPVHDQPGRPLARVGRLLRERQPDLAQPLGRRHQDRMQGGARDARRPAPGRAAAPDRGDRRHRQGHRDPRPAGRATGAPP